MDYLLLSLSVLCVAVHFSLTKVYQKRFTKGTGSLLFFPVVSSAVGFLFFLCMAGFEIRFGIFTFIMAFAYALACTVYTVLGIIIIRLGKLSVYIIFLMMGGMLIPFVYGIAFLNEAPTTARLIGMAVLVLSLFVPFISFKRDKPVSDMPNGKTVVGKKALKGKPGILIFLCVCVFILNGCVSTLSKVHQIDPVALDTTQFFIWNYIAAFFLSVSALGAYRLSLYFRAKNDGTGRETPGLENGTAAAAAYGGVFQAALLIVSISLIAGTGGLFLLSGAKALPASVLFPVSTGGSIVLTSFSGRIFFGERLNAQLRSSLVLTSIGTLLFLF
jgi:multidrug transporter EmrE-like cation transporter